MTKITDLEEGKARLHKKAMDDFFATIQATLDGLKRKDYETAHINLEKAKEASAKINRFK